MGARPTGGAGRATTIADVLDDMLANFSDLLAEDVPFARENPENYVAWREFVARPDAQKPLMPSMGITRR